MKKTIISLGVFFLGAFMLQAQNDSSIVQGGAEVNFEKDVHDFGTLKQNGDATYEFKFTNTGTEPLIITNAKGSCGCTVPSWPKEPIKPGDSSVIKVQYDSKRIGPINKSVTISSNATNEPTKVIRIKGNIQAVPTETEQTVPVKQAPAGVPVEQN